MNTWERLYQEIWDYCRQTHAEYQMLFCTNTHYPIPFFGDPSAPFFTVGVNPSWTEFKSRDRRDDYEPAECYQRLIGYFSSGFPFHRWFSYWDEAIALLGHGYQTDTFHLDLSPRATRSMGSFRDEREEIFLGMISSDLDYFAKLLTERISTLKGGFMAGTVTGRYYMDDFVSSRISRHGFQMKPIKASRKDGYAVKLYHLHHHLRQEPMPLAFFPRSPSAPNCNLKDAIRHYRSLLEDFGLGNVSKQ